MESACIVVTFNALEGTETEMDEILEQRNAAAEPFPALVAELDRLRAWVACALGEPILNDPANWPEQA